MNGFFLAFIASVFASFASVVTTKTVRYHNESNGYFTFYFLVSFCAACVINFFSFSSYTFNASLSLIGGFVGALLITSMVLVGKGVQKGPSGLTFAFLNSGAIAPPILLALIFSAPFGYTLNLSHFAGMTLVLGGLFWAATGTKMAITSKKWFLYALCAFITQAIILTLYQWHALLIQEDLPSHRLIPFHCTPKEDSCFMPAMFFLAFLLQGFLFLVNQKRSPTRWEMMGGTAGGILNGMSTFFLLLATSSASDHEKPMLFPIFAALVILLCSFLEWLFHKEKINWLALTLLAGGIFIGTLF